MLILFDIDGTLVRRTGPHHRDALVQAVRHVTGRDSTTDGIPVQGMLDPDILALMMSAAHMHADEIAQAMPAVIEEAQRVYLDVAADFQDRVCPGVPELLPQLTEHGVVLALVTGNLTSIGWHKLRLAGLDRYFRFGAFGEMASTRGGLVRLAIQEARLKGLIDGTAPIAMIGDAPQDIQAARENGIREISVRTGITLAEELEDLHPQVLLDDLTQFRLDQHLRGVI